MSAIKNALDKLKYKIPRPILEQVFIRRHVDYRQLPLSLDYEIEKVVIRPRVLSDCNLVGGTETLIDLNKVVSERVNNYVTVMRIPKQLTNGRSIQTALSITFSNPYYGTSGQTVSNMGFSSQLGAADSVLTSATNIPNVSTAQLEMIGENVVMCRDTSVLPVNAFLRCILANDENLNHIQLRSYPKFEKLVELAVKAHIYNDYVIWMDQGELSGGQELGKFKEIIEGYADANELYEDWLYNVWAKVAFMNDQHTFGRHIQRMMGSQR